MSCRDGGRLVVAGLAMLLCGAPLCAEQLGSVEVKKADAFRCQQLALDVGSTTRNGYTRLVNAPKGKSFVILWLDLKLMPGKDEDGDDLTQVSEETIQLTNSKGDSYPQVGRCTRDGRFSSYSSDFYHYGKPETDTVGHDLVFVVPDGGMDWSLKFGNTTAKVDVPQKPELTIDRTAVASFRLNDVRVVNKLEKPLRLGPYDDPIKTTETVESLAPKYLVVKLVIKPTKANQQNEFSVSSEEISVLYGSSVLMSPIGYFEGGEFYPGGTGFYSEQDAAGDFPARAAELVFLLPGRLTKFQLQYLGQKIGEGNIPASP